MINTLDPEQILLLKKRHKTEKSGDVRDRIKTVVLRNSGWTEEKIAEALLIHIDTVKRHLKDYHDSEGKKLKSENGGSVSKLNDAQKTELSAHLEIHTYTKVQDICEYVKADYNITYTVSGMTSWLGVNGFSYKKPKETPFKADLEKQQAFIEYYEDLKKASQEDEPILFVDSVHPTMATKVSYGWIKTGSDKAIGTVASRTRMNITGAIDLSTMKVISNEFETINGENIIKFLKQVIATYPKAKKVHLILDQAGYHKSSIVTDFASQNGIKLHYLPAYYSPNLNPIERLWKVMNETARNNVVFKSAEEFRTRIRKFFATVYPVMAQSLVDRLTDNFRVAVKASSF